MSNDYVDAMAKEHDGDAPVPTASSEAKPGTPVVGKDVSYNGNRAYLSTPVGPPPSFTMIVIHEWWGLNDQIKSMADQFAGLGAAALAIDLYQKEAASEVKDARKLMKEALADKPRLMENLNNACTYLEIEFPGLKRAVVGWCFGGMWSLQISLNYEMDATIIYYGHLVTEASELAPLKGPVLGLFGGKDRGIPVEMVKAFEAALQEAGKEHEICIYDYADHAFGNPSSRLYNKEAADAAWKKVVSFIGDVTKST